MVSENWSCRIKKLRDLNKGYLKLYSKIQQIKVIGQFLQHKNKLNISFLEIMIQERVDPRPFALGYLNAMDGRITADKNDHSIITRIIPLKNKKFLLIYRLFD